VSFASITLCDASQRVFIVVHAYFVIDSVRKLLDTPSYIQCFWLKPGANRILKRWRDADRFTMFTGALIPSRLSEI